MSFVQIVTVTSAHLDELSAVDDRWRADTAGRNTILRETLYTDANTPDRYVSVVEFASRADAERNSALPETAAAAARFGELATEVDYLDLEFVRVLGDRRAELVAGLLELIQTGKVLEGVFTDDLVCDLVVPMTRIVVTGADAIADMVQGSMPAGSTVEEQRWEPTPDGFVLEFAARTVATPEHPSTYFRELAWATIRDHRIARVAVYCGGDWDPETEARNTP